MKFLVDAQLPRSLVKRLNEQGHAAIHTLDLPLGNRTLDAVINELSITEQYIIITKDADFVISFVMYNQILIKTMSELQYQEIKRKVKMSQIKIDRVRIDEFCRKHHIRKLALFGSVLRDDFSPKSDIDVLVEFEPEHTPGLNFFAIEAELSEIMGRRIDLNTPQFISPLFRGEVEREAEVQYEQA